MNDWQLLSGSVNANMVNDNTINAMGGARYKYVPGLDYAEASHATVLNTSVPLDTNVIYADCPTFIPEEHSITYLTDANYNEGITE